MTFVKHVTDPRHAAWEAAGLRWLGAAADGPDVVEVLEVTGHSLVLGRVEPGTPTAAAAEDLGRRLAAMHAAGAPGHGAGPPGWAGDGYLGPSHDLLPLPLGCWPDWGSALAEGALLPTARLAAGRGRLDAGTLHQVERVCHRLLDGAYADGHPPARLHGDLWSGNVLWSPSGAVLIDPAVRGGHPEADLAMLALFGAPQLERIRAAYHEVSAPAEGWQSRVVLHQLHPLLVHVACFGGGYVDELREALRQYC